MDNKRENIEIPKMEEDVIPFKKKVEKKATKNIVKRFRKTLKLFAYTNLKYFAYTNLNDKIKAYRNKKKVKHKIFKIINEEFLWEKKESYKNYREKYIRVYVYIRINCNNTIATLTRKNGEVIYTLSAGKLKLRSSKKNYKYIQKIVLKKFFEYLRKKKYKNNIYFKLTIPKHLRKPILQKVIRPRMKKKKYIVEFLRLLSFNGCRAPKKRRKKRQGLRVFQKFQK